MSGVKTRVSENPYNFNLVVDGAALDSNDTHELKLGEEWIVNLIIEEHAGRVNDKVSIKGEAWHAKGPHDEGRSGDNFKISLVWDADKPPKPEGAGRVEIRHGTHIDIFTAELAATKKGVVFDRISGYSLTLTGRHSERF